MSAVIEPATEALLAQMRAGGGKPLYEMTVEEVRAMVVGSSAVLGGPPVEVGSAIDRTITTRVVRSGRSATGACGRARCTPAPSMTPTSSATSARSRST